MESVDVGDGLNMPPFYPWIKVGKQIDRGFYDVSSLLGEKKIHRLFWDGLANWFKESGPKTEYLTVPKHMFVRFSGQQ